jgi:hypothetical protein
LIVIGKKTLPVSAKEPGIKIQLYFTSRTIVILIFKYLQINVAGSINTKIVDQELTYFIK